MAYFIKLQLLDAGKTSIINLDCVSHVSKHGAVAACITMSNGNIMFARAYSDVIKEMNIRNKELS